MKKKVLLIFILFILLVNSFMFVRAGPMEGIANMLHSTLGGVFEFMDIKNFAGGDAAKAFFLARFSIWILVFASLFYVSRFVFPDHKAVRIAVPMVIALISVVLIPQDLILKIFSTYSVVIMFGLYLLPIIGVLFLIHKAPGEGVVHHSVRIFGYGVLIFLIYQVDGSIEDMQANPGAFGMTDAGVRSIDKLEGYMDYLYIIPALGAIWSIFGIFASLGKGGSFVQGIGNLGGHGGGGGTGGGAGGGVSPEELEKRLAAIRKEQGEEGATERDMVKEGQVDEYIQRAQAIEANLDAHKQALDNTELSLEERKKGVQNAMVESATTLGELEKQFILLENKVERGEVQNAEAVKVKVEELSGAIMRVRERIQQFAEDALLIIQQQEQVVGAEQVDEDQGLAAETGEIQGEVMEENLEGAAVAEEGAIEGQAKRTGQKKTANDAAKVKGIIKKEKGKTRKERRTTKRKMGKGKKARGIEEKDKAILEEQKRLIQRVAILTNSIATQRLDSTTLNRSIKDLNDCLTQLGKSEANLFRDEKQVKRLHEKIKKFDIKGRRIESAKQSLLQKAANALRKEKKETGK